MNTSKAPDKIYLQVCGTCPLEGVECERCNFGELEEVTWSTDKVFDKDVAYIRKDALLEWAKKELETRRNTGDDYYLPAIVVLNDLIEKINSL